MKKPLIGTVNGNLKVAYFSKIFEIETKDQEKLIVERRVPANGISCNMPVLLVHGLLQNRYTWDLPERSFMNYLVNLGFDTWNVELRGVGLSGLAGSHLANGVLEYARFDLPAVINTVLKKTKQDKLFYIGHSLGGMLAYGLDTTFAAHFAGVVTIGSPFTSKGILFPLTKQINKIIDVFTKKIRLSNNKDMDFKRKSIRFDIFGKFLNKTLFYFDKPNMFPFAMWAPNSIEQSMLKKRISMGYDCSGLGVLLDFIKWRQNNGFKGVREWAGFPKMLKKSFIPFLFIAGNKDRLAPPGSVVGAFHYTKSKNREFKVFDCSSCQTGYGHIDLICGRCAPDTVWPYVNQWLNKHKFIE